MPDESNAITFKYDIGSIDFTNGFFNKSVLNTCGENLFNSFKGTKENSGQVKEVTTDGIEYDSVTFTASSEGKFYIGAYRTPWSSWTSAGRIETFFAVFYKHPDSENATEDWVDINFPDGYIDSNSVRKPLTIRRKIEKDSFWIYKPSGSTITKKEAFKEKLIPIFAFHSKNRRCFSNAGDTGELNNFQGWCYPYYVGGTNSTLSDPVPSNIYSGYNDNITEGTRRNIFGSRIRTSFIIGCNPADNSRVPVFVLDMNNGQRITSGEVTYTQNSFNASFSEGCIVPSGVALQIEETSDARYFTGNEFTTEIAASGFTPSSSDNGKKKAFIVNSTSSSPSGTKFNGHVGIRAYTDGDSPVSSGWNDAQYSMACGIAFFMNASGDTDTDFNSRSFYTTGSWGISQLFPNLSVEEKTVHFYGLTDSDHVSGTVFVGDVLGSNSYGWPQEGDDKPSWIKRVGYTLHGWYTTRSYETRRSSNWQVKSSSPANINLYAKWDTIPYKITYNPDGGTMSSTEQDYNIETNLRLYSAPTKAGYTFDGWKVDVASGSWSTGYTYPASQIIGPGAHGNITLKAQWSTTKYTAKFEPNGGKFSDNETNYKTKEYYITQELLVPNSISREGYKFSGWKVTSVTSPTNWHLNDIYNDPDNQRKLHGSDGMYGSVTFTAQWTVRQYTVTSTANPSSMGTASGSGDYNYGLEVEAKATARTGHKFINWTIPSDLTLTSGTTINSATIKFNMPAKNVSIMANFEAREYSLSFDLNVGKGCPTSDDDDGGNVPSKPATRTVIFGGYYAGKNSSTGEAYTTFPGLATNGGPDDWSAYFDAWKWDYRFLGWFTASEGGIQPSADSRYEIAGNSTLWAHWQATQKQYVVTWKDWDQVGTDRYIKRKTLDAGTLIASENPEDPVRTGYTFTGWQIQGQYSYDDVRKDLTLIAQYNPITYWVRFNKNKNSGSSAVEGTMSNQQFTYDQAQNLTNNAFSRMGYTFNGWNESSDFKANPDYTNKQSVINLESTQGAIHNLYANWKAKRVKVNFDVNTNEETQSPVSPVSSIYVYFDTAYGSGVHDITRAGYTFLGWFTEKTGGSQVTSETILTSTDQEHTLYAHWQVIRYRIIFHPRKGSEVQDKRFSIETKFPLRIYDESERSGYEFLGWSTNSNGSNYKYPYIVNEFVAHNINLYAAWRIALRPFEPKPGEPGEPQDEFGIPIDELDPDCKYTLVLSVKGDRTSTDGKSKWQLQSYEGEYQNSVPYSWVNTIKVGDSTKLTPAQLKSAINDYVVFPMDVWRCRIRHTSAVLHVSLTEYQEDNTSFESSTDNDFSIPASCIPTIVTTKLHDGVITIKSLDLYANNMASTKRFIGNAKSSVLIDITSSSMNSGSELLYDAVPQAYGVKLEYVGSQQVGGDWVESKIRNIDPELVQDYITNSQNYKYSNTNEYRYKVENFIVSEIPFPKIEEHLFGARIRLKVFDTRHSNKD